MFDLHSKFRTLAWAGAAIALAGCDGQPERSRVDPERTTPAVTQQELPGDESPSDVAAVTARARVSDLRVGSVLGVDGAVVENVDEIPRGGSLFASVAVGDVGAGSILKAVWLAEDDRKLSEATATVEAGMAHLAFPGPDTAGWTIGEYEVEIYLGDELAASEQFEIVEREG
ncbi:MAG: hypothetical protein AMXMBFR36_33720 [Acidobacteriota bacterium]